MYTHTYIHIYKYKHTHTQLTLTSRRPALCAATNARPSSAEHAAHLLAICEANRDTSLIRNSPPPPRTNIRPWAYFFCRVLGGR